MLVSVEGCSSPNTLFLVSITYTSSSSASVHRPASFTASPTTAIPLNVSIYSLLSGFFLTSINPTNNFSASLRLPFYHVYYAGLACGKSA